MLAHGLRVVQSENEGMGDSTRRVKGTHSDRRERNDTYLVEMVRERAGGGGNVKNMVDEVEITPPTNFLFFLFKAALPGLIDCRSLYLLPRYSSCTKICRVFQKTPSECSFSSLLRKGTK